MLRQFSFTILLTALFSLTSLAHASDTIILNTGIKDPFTTKNGSGFVDLLVKEIFHRQKIKGKVIVYQNSAKSLDNANEGIDDGVALRVKGLEKKYPNLIRIPEKVMDNDFVAYTMSKRPPITNWKSLNDFKISYINGWQIFQNNLKSHPNTIKTKHAQEMFDLLAENKVEYMLYERWQGLWRAKQLELHIEASEPPLATRGMYMYLNNKHEDIVEDTAQVLAEMKKDGTYISIFNSTLGRLNN